jgi:hypothetical protein
MKTAHIRARLKRLTGQPPCYALRCELAEGSGPARRSCEVVLHLANQAHKGFLQIGGPCLGHDLRRRALGQHLAIGDVDQLVAALGLVHVVGGHQHRHAFIGQAVDLVPEVAPRLRVDAGGGFVQKQQAWLVDHAGGQGQALLPATRQRPGQLLLARGQAQLLQRLVHGRFAVGHFEQPCDEVQVLANGEVVVEAKLLRHIADLALDGGRLGDDVQPQAGAAARVRGQEAAQHADAGGLAAAVGAEEAADAPGSHLDVDVVDHGTPAVVLGEASDVNGQWGAGVAHGCFPAGAGADAADGAVVVATRRTSSGWPGRRRGASVALARASTMNTSLARWALE